MNHILPSKKIPYTYMAYLQQVGRKTKIVYIGTLLFLAGVGCSLPYIYTDVYVRSEGYFAPSLQRQNLIVPLAGLVDSVYVRDNARVRKGQVLLRLHNQALSRNRDIVQSQIEQKTREVEDLHLLGSYDFLESGAPAPPLKTRAYHLAYVQLSRQVEELEVRLQVLRKKHQTETGLFNKGVVTRSDYEDSFIRLEEAEGQLKKMVEDRQLDWKNRLRQAQDEVAGLRQSNIEVEQNIGKLTVSAPLDGTVQLLSGLSPGIRLLAGAEIAKLSPDTTLMADCFVSPKDIGLIRQGQAVKFQVHAYDYNDWGLASGEVVEIGHDVILAPDNTPVFKVKCRMGQYHLRLKNGYRGEFKKGMTLTAHFVVTRRSLFNLLFDKADDWLNPMNNE